MSSDDNTSKENASKELYESARKLCNRRLYGNRGCSIDTIDETDRKCVGDLITKHTNVKLDKHDLDNHTRRFVGTAMEQHLLLASALPKGGNNHHKDSVAAMGSCRDRKVCQYRGILDQPYTKTYSLNQTIHPSEEKKFETMPQNKKEEFKNKKLAEKENFKEVLLRTDTLRGVNVALDSSFFDGVAATNDRWKNLLFVAEMLLNGEDLESEDNKDRKAELNNLFCDHLSIAPNLTRKPWLSQKLNTYCKETDDISFRPVKCSFIQAMNGYPPGDAPTKDYLIIGEIRHQGSSTVFLFHPPSGCVFPTNNEEKAVQFGGTFRLNCDKAQRDYDDNHLRRLTIDSDIQSTNKESDEEREQREQRERIVNHPAVKNIYSAFSTHILGHKQKTKRTNYTASFEVRSFYYLILDPAESQDNSPLGANGTARSNGAGGKSTQGADGPAQSNGESTQGASGTESTQHNNGANGTASSTSKERTSASFRGMEKEVETLRAMYNKRATADGPAQSDNESTQGADGPAFSTSKERTSASFRGMEKEVETLRAMYNKGATADGPAQSDNESTQGADGPAFSTSKERTSASFRGMETEVETLPSVYNKRATAGSPTGTAQSQHEAKKPKNTNSCPSGNSSEATLSSPSSPSESEDNY